MTLAVLAFVFGANSCITHDPLDPSEIVDPGDKPGDEPGDEPGDKPGDEPGSDPTPGTALNLSEKGTANCYMISAEGTYSFNAKVRGNGTNAGVSGLEAPAAIAPAGAKLVWQTPAGLLSDVALNADGTISFKASSAAGNALIAATDGSGKILWSWHIWKPKDAPASIQTASGYKVMDMNLGAMVNGVAAHSVETYGLLYQWGRKDPFPGSPTLTGTTDTKPAKVYDAAGAEVTIAFSSWSDTDNNNLEYSIANPTVVLDNFKQYYLAPGKPNEYGDWLVYGKGNDALWGNPTGNVRDPETNTYLNKGKKTYYDPCPAGWRVPPVDVFRFVTPSGGYDENLANFKVADINGDGTITAADFNYGWVLLLNANGDKSFFPATGRYDGSYGQLMGSVAGLWGNYWSNSPDGAGLGFSPLSFQAGSMSPAAAARRADAYSVRCIEDK